MDPKIYRSPIKHRYHLHYPFGVKRLHKIIRLLKTETQIANLIGLERMTKKIIAYVGHMLFPWGQAASRRVYGNAMSLCESGYDVIVASGSDGPSNRININQTNSGAILSHIGLGTCPNQKHSSLKKIFRLIFDSSKITIDWLESQKNKPRFIVLYGGYTPYMIRLLPWCRKNNIPLIADIVEWYDPSHHYLGKFNFSYINVDFCQKYLFPKCDGIISISTFLEQYYRNKGCKTLKVPPTVDSDLFSPLKSSQPSQLLTLVYAGSPGKKKDLLKNVINAVLRVDPDGKRIRLKILGPSLATVQNICGGISLPSSVEALGRIPQPEVSIFVHSADFSVLLREPLRHAQAGFPTKFVESLTNATPVIANITSDLGDYLIDGVNGLVCRDHTVQSLTEVLNYALQISKEKLNEMRFSAQRTARDYFDYRNYSEKFASFLEGLKK